MGRQLTIGHTNRIVLNRDHIISKTDRIPLNTRCISLATHLTFRRLQPLPIGAVPIWLRRRGRTLPLPFLLIAFAKESLQPVFQVPEEIASMLAYNFTVERRWR